MVDRSKLTVGEHYFYITYEDPNLKVPVIETLRYVGPSQEEEAGVPYQTFERIGSSQLPKSCRLTEDLLFCVHDWDGLIAELVENKRAQDAGVPFDNMPGH